MSTTKFGSAPTTYTNDALSATAAGQIAWSNPTSGNIFTTARSVKVHLVGQSDAAKEPTKTINAWWASNSAAINTASLQKSLYVSSWAIVVDIEWATDPKTPVVQAPGTAYTMAASQTSPHTSAVQVGSNNYPDAGTFGDTLAIFLTVKDQTYQPAAIRIGRKVTTKGVCTNSTCSGTTSPADIKQADVLVLESWSYTKITADYADNAKNLSINPSYSTQTTCDTTRWDSATACNGVAAPWAFGSVTAAVTTGTVANGKVRAWHFLADAATDKSTIWSIEKTDVLYFFLHETMTPTVGSTYSATGTIVLAQGDGKPLAYDTAAGKNVFKYTWDIKSFSVTGASSTVLGAAAIVAGVIASMF